MSLNDAYHTSHPDLLRLTCVLGLSSSLSEHKADHQLQMDVVVIFRHATRIAKTLVDLGLERCSGHIVKHGLELSVGHSELSWPLEMLTRRSSPTCSLRAMNAKAWEGRGAVLCVLRP